MVATEDMESFIPANEEALTNTMRIAEMCNVEIDLGKARLPSFQTPRGQPPEEHLHELCELGLTHRYPIQKLDDGTWALAEGHSEDELPVSIPQILERLNFELGVINSMNFAEYFLIVWDFVNYAKKSDIIVGPGRGSAAGALVTYSLGITDLDPLAYDLLFERFLNPDRVSMPDADIDFDDEHRDEVIEYVRQKYGKDCVASIITFGTMRAKAAIKDVGRAMGLPYGERDQLAKLVPPRPGVELADCLEDEPEFKKAYDENDVNKKIIDLAIELEGVSRHTSVHPCAVVISDRPLENFVPLQHAPRSDDVVITEYGAKALEALGLLKMDFLGLRNLTVIRKTIKLIQKDHGVDIDIYNLPMDDAITYELLCKGETTAVFQLESAGMKRYLRQLRPNRFEDIIAMVALYRPGPMQFIEEYCERKHGRKSVQYDHPSMEAALKNTHGITVYQEQVMQMSRDLAGFTRGEADFLRVAMGKKIVSMMEELKDKFMVGATGHGIDEKLANKIWADWEKFASYAFNKSHAACYAFVAYQTAYLKAHYPREFMAASLTSEMDKSDRIIVLIDECRRMGEQIRPPDVNESNLEFSVEPEGIRFGLLAVRNLGAQAIEAMLEARDEGGRFTSLFDFCRRVDLKAINKRMVESLTKAGAMDAFGDRGQLLQGADMAVGWGQDEQDNASRGQTSLFEAAAKEGDSGPSAIPELPKVPPLSGPERLAQERELLGFYISGHPLDAHRRDIELFCSHASDALPETSGGTPLLTAGVIMSIRRITTKKGKSMAVLICEDFAGSYEAVVFPDALKEADRHLIVDNAVMIRGARDDDEPKVLVDQLIPMADARQILAKALDVTVATSRLTEEGIAELQRIVSINGGSLPVYLHVATKAHGTFAFQVSGGRINPTDDFLALVESHPATEAVKLRAAPLVAREPRRRPSQRDGYPQRGQ